MARRAVAEVWSDREGARGVLDLAYLVYIAVVSVLVLGVPALRAAGILLARPDVLPVLSAPVTGALLGGGSLMGAALLVLAGAGHGPAVLAPFFAVTLAASERPRRTALIRPFARSGIAIALVLLAVSIVLGRVLVLGAQASTGGAVALAAASLGIALAFQGAWLAGQVLGAGARRLLAGLLALAGIAVALVGALSGSEEAQRALAGAYPALPGAAAGASPEQGTVLWALGLLVLGLLVVAACIPALDRVRGRVLVDQGRRWESATTAARSSDLAAAAGTYRALPTTGRRLRAVRGGGRGPLALAALYLRRDLVALMRTPERLLIAAAGVLLAGGLLALSRGLTGPLAVLALVIGALMLWSASGVFVDGLRHGIQTIGAPRLFGQSTRAQVLLHSPAPLLVLIVLSAAGSACALLIGPGTGPAAAGGGAPAPAAAALVLAPALAATLVLGRIRDAAKGPMPLALTTPMPTVQGDASIVPMLLWQADAPLFALVIAAALTAALGSSWALATGVWVLALVLLALDARRRVLELSPGAR
ncbi:hypothetical protein DEO23_07010 [Brachybacterium endophyticum]|uniref:Uncharacterized protein n=1 Tax=Brachybacterium endophyticum TaxID=2182385 RepID=A0A2U2RME2_9MICO|nr:hypothetical protein DEO23_07010 [Brachybacterium endophyticum]